jgi:hypothetical protein
VKQETLILVQYEFLFIIIAKYETIKEQRTKPEELLLYIYITCSILKVTQHLWT